MVVDERAEQVDNGSEAEGGADHLWCYLVVLRGELYAVPDEGHAVSLPYINRLAAVTPLPLGLVPAYVLGLVNVGQNGEVVIDLGAYLGLTGAPAPRELRRLLVIGEQVADHGDSGGSEDGYRLAFAVDRGHELTTVRPESYGARDGAFTRGWAGTRYGQAAVLDMAAICADIVRALGAERPWSVPAEARVAPEGEKE